jgi:hypothetical protein
MIICRHGQSIAHAKPTARLNAMISHVCIRLVAIRTASMADAPADTI